MGCYCLVVLSLTLACIVSLASLFLIPVHGGTLITSHRRKLVSHNNNALQSERLVVAHRLGCH